MLSFTLEHMLDKVSGPTWPIYVAICSKLIKANLSKSVGWLITYDCI